VARGAESWLLFAPWFVVPFAGEGELGGKPEDYNRTIGGFAMRFVTAIAVCLAPISSAFGQIDATTLRAKYGDPINYGKRVNTETFKVRDNIEIVVYYGPSEQVCRIELHPRQSRVGQALPDNTTKQQVDGSSGSSAPFDAGERDTFGGDLRGTAVILAHRIPAFNDH
jgi:hypothetical protein